MKRILVAFLLMAAPAGAEECFTGIPRQVTYNDGRTITIIQRHGDDLTFTTPYEGNQDAVQKTHLMLFPKQSRHGARSSENRWTSKLPHLDDLVPGFQFDIKGTMKSGEGEGVPYRKAGQVLRHEEVMVGKCSYDTLVIEVDTYLKDEVAIKSTEYLSPDMMVILKSDVLPISAGQMIHSTAVAIQ